MAVQWRATKWDSGDCYDGGQYTSIGNPSRQSMYEIAVYNNCSNLHFVHYCFVRIVCVQVSPRVICCHYVPSCQLVLLGTLDFVIQAIDCKTKYVYKLYMRITRNSTYINFVIVYMCT